MEPLRIVLAGLPRMLGDLIVALLAPDRRWRVATILHGTGPIAPDIDRWKPDVVITSTALAAEQDLDQLLFRWPYMLVLAIDDDAHSATLHRLAPLHERFGVLTLRSLTDVLEAASAIATTNDAPS